MFSITPDKGGSKEKMQIIVNAKEVLKKVIEDRQRIDQCYQEAPK